MTDAQDAPASKGTGPRPLDEPASTGDARLDAFARLLAIVDRLRAPEDGCPWDLEQTVPSMASSLTEEAFEAVETIDREDDAGTVEELGDLVMVVALIARIASEQKRFDLATIAHAVSDKLIRRHPHVFGDVVVEGSEVAVANWEKIKQKEREGKRVDASVLAGVPVALPALQRADRIAQKAISAGFEWNDVAGAFAKLREEVGELDDELATTDGTDVDRERVASELGDVLIAAAFLGTYLKLDPEKLLRDATGRFERRFRSMEESVEGRLSDHSLEHLVAAWQAAKKATDDDR